MPQQMSCDCHKVTMKKGLIVLLLEDEAFAMDVVQHILRMSRDFGHDDVEGKVAKYVKASKLYTLRSVSLVRT